MIFTIHTMPEDHSDPQCLVKGFNNETTPLIFEQAVNTNEERNTFFYFFKNLSQDKTFNPSLGEFQKKIEFLKKYLKFLSAGQQSNYNFHFRVQLFLNGSQPDSNSQLQALLQNFQAKESQIFEPKFEIQKNLLFAYLYNVYTFFLCVQKFAQRKMDEHMRDYMYNQQFNIESFEFVLNVYKLGFGRILKFNLVRDSVLGFFVNDKLPVDFSLGTLSVFTQIYEINFINLVLYKIMFRKDNYKTMASNVKLICIYINWFMEARKGVDKLIQVLPNCLFDWKADLARFLAKLKLYYEIMENTFIIRYNFLLEKEKDKMLESDSKRYNYSLLLLLL